MHIPFSSPAWRFYWATSLSSFAILTKTFGISEGLLPPDPRMDRFFRIRQSRKRLHFWSSQPALWPGTYFRGRERMALLAVRTTGLRPHDALGHSRSDADHLRLSEHFLELHGEHYRTGRKVRITDFVHKTLSPSAERACCVPTWRT